MSSYNAILFVVAFVRVATSLTVHEIDTFPVCIDEFMESVSSNDLATKYSKEGDKGFVWFCYFSGLGLTRFIDVYSCASDNENSCLRDWETVGDDIYRMDVCIDEQKYANFRRRVLTCMPWEINPVMTHTQILLQAANVGYKDFDGREKSGMTHLRTQFLEKFKPLWLYNKAPPKLQDAMVRNCASGTDVIQFASEACWHSDADVVFLKPQYKFKVKPSSKKTVCEMSNTEPATDALSYIHDSVTYTKQSIPKKFTYCKWWGKNLQWYDEFARPFIKDQWNAKKIQYLGYKPIIKSTLCTDSVTESCVDNVFSFFAKECVWVRQPATLLSTMLEPLETDYKEKFETYGDQMYVMNLGVRNIEVSVGVMVQKVLSWEKWNGVAKKLDPRSTWLQVTAKTGYSCSGCKSTASTVQAQSPTVGQAPCGVPQQCVVCKAWQRVEERGTWSMCTASFVDRTCTACPAHHERSSADEKNCVLCPPLKPMRQEGQEECAACQHTQYFDKTSANGCLYFMSVADGLTFTGGVLFNKAYVDQYKPADSTRAPETVPALHYRNLMEDGNTWDKSSIASKCEESKLFDNTYPGIFTRNMYGYKIQYRSWCGHEEIVKDNNAQLKLISCNFVTAQGLKIADTGQVFANTISLKGLFTFAGTTYDLSKERQHLSNRVTEIKLTAKTNNGLSCYYEFVRKGKADDCTYCNGTQYTKDCGPTYSASLETPVNTWPGTCEKCEEQCVNAEHFFDASLHSCWSNGTGRVSSNVLYGSVTSIGLAMSTARNYWYKPAACVACRKLTDASVPQIVTRCGNKATFEVWHPTQEILVLQVSRPKRRVCCAIDNSAMSGSGYSNELEVRCVIESDVGALDITILTGGTTPLCQTYVPDLSTASVPFCPPGWFFDKAVGGCDGPLQAWSHKCCSRCSLCATAGALKTNQYKLCSGDTAEDTQLAGCVTSCAEKNYQVGNDSCVECESCG